ncbi:protein transport protein SEC24 [Fistulifera solaris]|uniref:Protein transport protein SEC24 n=1 Tax=Fistulifera solaris TaxID=1519565 RepID=A0A1Z5KG86_FISSO|nr:protein transport protein SEC24 [Fistulifera solaris]|eukprot:GAX25112.1 protein transport protein SEC24 [Fistulifera solaris]
MSNFPPPPGQRFVPPPGGRFQPPPAVGGTAAPPPPFQAPGTTQLNSAMGSMSLQSGQRFAPPPPPGQIGAPGGAPPAPGKTFRPPGSFGPPGGAVPQPGFQPPPAVEVSHPPQPAVFQAPPGGGGVAPPGSQIFQPAAPRPGPQMMSAPPAAVPQPAPSHFYQQAPAGSAAPGMMPGALPSAAPVNENVDYNIQIPDRIFRLACTKLPQSANQATACKAPLGGILRPLAPLASDEEEVATVVPGTAGIVRCKRCRTYINAFVSWSEHGRKWRCNICGQVNDCPSAYFCHLDEQGLRRDRLERPELSKAIVEYVAPAEYMVRPPQEPSYFFVLDVSATAVRSGMLAAAAQGIKASLDDLPGLGRTKVAFVTFDSSVHYYNLAPDLSSPQMLVVSDLKNLFVPLPEHLLVNLRESRAMVDTFLDNLPDMFAANPVVSQSCLGSALKAAYTVMKDVGGKMCVFQSILPNMGDGSLKPREQPALMGTPNEVKVLRPENTWYKDTAIEFSRNQISVDMYLFPYQYMDLASLGDLPKYTAGTLHSYPSFNLERDGQRFEEQLNKNLTQTTAFEAVMRIRCTKGMKITNFYGNFFIRGQDLMALPNCNTDSVYAFDLAHDDQNLLQSFVTVQAALLYTSSVGERRIRVMTQALPVTSSTSDVIASIDCDACSALMAKQALDFSLKTGLDQARMRMQQVCVEVIRSAKGGDKRMVSGYAVPPADQSGGGAGEDKSIPDNLQLLPLYTLAMMKNVAFRGGTDVHPDERIQAHHLLNAMYVNDSKHYVYPRMFEIHNMGQSSGLPSEDSVNESDEDRTAGRNRILLPPVANLSVERLTSDGVFLLDNGVEMYLWVGRTADMNVIGSLFGVHSLDDVDPQQVKVLTSGDSFATRFGAVVHALRDDVADPYTVSAKINIVKEGDAFWEGRFFWFMVEDRASFQGGTHSYLEFMDFVHNPGASAGARLPAAGPPGPMPGPPGRPGPPGAPGSFPPSQAMPPPQPGRPMAPPMGAGGMAAPPPPNAGPPPPQYGMPPPQPPQRGMQPPPPPQHVSGPPPPQHGMQPPPPQQHSSGPPPPPHGKQPPPLQQQTTGPPPPPHGMQPPPQQPLSMPPPHSAPPAFPSQLGPQGQIGGPPRPGPPSAASGGYAMPPPPGRAVLHHGLPPQRNAMPPPPPPPPGR